MFGKCTTTKVRDPKNIQRDNENQNRLIHMQNYIVT
jgi:hypothetical protein